VLHTAHGRTEVVAITLDCIHRLERLISHVAKVRLGLLVIAYQYGWQ
jgi:hypothetical protein